MLRGESLVAKKKIKKLKSDRGTPFLMLNGEDFPLEQVSRENLHHSASPSYRWFPIALEKKVLQGKNIVNIEWQNLTMRFDHVALLLDSEDSWKLITETWKKSGRTWKKTWKK